MLLYYLKKLGVSLADQILFISDGAKWIWERVKGLICGLGIEAKQCWMALDFYHAVEHLTSITALKKWKQAEAKKWVSKQRKRLLNGKLELFFEESRAFSTIITEHRQLSDRQVYRSDKPTLPCPYRNAFALASARNQPPT